LSDVKFSVGDSVVLDTKKNVVSKVLGLKEGAKVEVIGGKHAGEKGELVGFEELVRGQNYEIKLENGTVRLPYKTILVIA
jgi:ribosomal protein S4E